MAVVLVDVANVMGARPDGWWKDRVGAATRLLVELRGLIGRSPDGPGGVVVTEIVAVLEGLARRAEVPEGIEAVLAPADGDSEIVRRAEILGRADGAEVVVVTADRGLRARLPDGMPVRGPRWLLDALES